MKLTITTLLIAVTLVMASTSVFAANDKTLRQFTSADKNKDGQVTVAEMTNSIKRAHAKHPDNKSVLRAFKKHGKENAAMINAKAWIEKNDKNADGIVSLDEVTA